jgi:hypothetical protein
MIMTKSAYRGHEVVSLRNIRPAKATPAAPLLDEYGRVLRVERAAGTVRCGACGHHHNGAAAVRLCYEQQRAANDAAYADYLAEQRAERWFEERGYGYEEARAQEQWEETNGMW